MKRTIAILAVLAFASVAVAQSPIVSLDSYQIKKTLQAEGYPLDLDTTFDTTPYSGNWNRGWEDLNSHIESAEFGLSSGLSLPSSPAWNQMSAVGFDSSSWDRYFYLNVEVEDGWQMELDGLIYGGLKASGTGPVAGKTTIIVDGGTEEDVRAYSITGSYANYTDDLSSDDLVAYDTVEVRWYGKGASSHLGTHRVGDHYDNGNYTNLGINGTVTQVPEPATMALLGLGGVAALIRRRRA